MRGVAAIRTGGGPRLVEFSTYRWLEHCGPSFDNHIGYRTESEFLEWQAKEPIARFEKVMLENFSITREELQLMNDHISLEVEEAFNFAEGFQCLLLIELIQVCTLSNLALARVLKVKEFDTWQL